MVAGLSEVKAAIPGIHLVLRGNLKAIDENLSLQYSRIGNFTQPMHEYTIVVLVVQEHS